MIRFLPRFAAIFITAATAIFCTFFVNAETTKMPNPPVAQVKPHTVEMFGDKRVDDYFWLREKGDPKVIDYLKAENDYTDTYLGPMKAFQEALYKDMLSRIKETDENVPYKKGSYWYYSRTEMGKQYNIYCRKKSLNAVEEIILDLNVLGKDKKFLGLGDFEISPDGGLLAYTLDFTDRKSVV